LSFVAKWKAGTYAIIAMKKIDLFKDIFNHLIEKHNAETFKIKKLKFAKREVF
jgi:hypothetical protein